MGCKECCSDCFGSIKLLVTVAIGLLLGTSMFSFYSGFSTSYLQTSQPPEISCSSCGNYSESQLLSTNSCAVIVAANSTNTGDSFATFAAQGYSILIYIISAVAPVILHDFWLYRRVKKSMTFVPFREIEQRSRKVMFIIATIYFILAAFVVVSLCIANLVNGLALTITAEEFRIHLSVSRRNSCQPTHMYPGRGYGTPEGGPSQWGVRGASPGKFCKFRLQILNSGHLPRP